MVIPVAPRLVMVMPTIISLYIIVMERLRFSSPPVVNMRRTIAFLCVMAMVYGIRFCLGRPLSKAMRRAILRVCEAWGMVWVVAMVECFRLS